MIDSSFSHSFIKAVILLLVNVCLLVSLSSCNLAIGFIDFIVESLEDSGDDGTAPKPPDVPENIYSMTEISAICTGDASSVTTDGNFLYMVGSLNEPYNFSIVDFTNPLNWRITKSLDAAGYAIGITSHDGYAYYSTSGAPVANGIVAVRCTNPDAPVIAGYTTDGFMSANQLYYYNGYVYHCSDYQLSIYSVPDPYKTEYQNSMTTSNVAWAAFQDNFLYIVNAFTTFSVYELVTPTNPGFKGQYNLESTQIAGGLAVKGEYAYITFSDSTYMQTGIAVINNLSSPGSLSWVSTLILDYSNDYPVYEAKIYGNYLFVSSSNTFYAIDIRDQGNPHIDALVSLYNTGGFGFTVTRGYAIVADKTVFRVIRFN